MEDRGYPDWLTPLTDEEIREAAELARRLPDWLLPSPDEDAEVVPA